MPPFARRWRLGVVVSSSAAGNIAAASTKCSARVSGSCAHSTDAMNGRALPASRLRPQPGCWRGRPRSCVRFSVPPALADVESMRLPASIVAWLIRDSAPLGCRALPQRAVEQRDCFAFAYVHAIRTRVAPAIVTRPSSGAGGGSHQFQVPRGRFVGIQRDGRGDACAASRGTTGRAGGQLPRCSAAKTTFLWFASTMISGTRSAFAAPRSALPAAFR